MQKAKVKFIFAKTISKIISSFVFGKKDDIYLDIM